MFNKTTMQEYRRTLKRTDEATGMAPRRSGRFATVLVRTWITGMALMAVSQVWGQSITKTDFKFTNAVDTTQGFSVFGSMPAINNAGAVAFQALAYCFAHLCSSFGPFYKWLKDFSRMCVQSRVVENLFSPGGLPQISKDVFEGYRRLALVPKAFDS